MSETRVVKVADGEELVFEGVAQCRPAEDARERTIEVRRLAVLEVNSDEAPSSRENES